MLVFSLRELTGFAYDVSLNRIIGGVQLFSFHDYGVPGEILTTAEPLRNLLKGRTKS